MGRCSICNVPDLAKHRPWCTRLVTSAERYGGFQVGETYGRADADVAPTKTTAVFGESIPDHTCSICHQRECDHRAPLSSQTRPADRKDWTVDDFHNERVTYTKDGMYRLPRYDQNGKLIGWKLCKPTDPDYIAPGFHHCEAHNRTMEVGVSCPECPPVEQGEPKQEQTIQDPELEAVFKEPVPEYTKMMPYSPAHPPALAQDGLNPKDLIGCTKTPLGLLPWTALVQVAKVFAVGAKKYGAYNWRTKGQPVQHVTYVEAAFRHLAAYMDGQTIDPETGCNHLAHAACGLLILLDASAVGNSIDNRPTPGTAAEIMALDNSPKVTT